MRRRVRRIYPVFLLVLGLYLVLSHLFPSESKLPASMSATFVYVAQNVLLVPLGFGVVPIIVVTWSLGFEMVFYICIPLLVIALKMHRWAPWQRAAFFSVLTLSIFLGQLLPTSVPKIEVQYAMFAGGILVYEAAHSFDIRRLAREPVVFVSAVLALTGTLFAPSVLHVASGSISLNAGHAWALRSLILFPSYTLLVLCATMQDSRLGRVMMWRPFVYLGDMSYSWYLIHGLALKGFVFLVFPLLTVVGFTGPSAAMFLGLLPFALLATLVASTLLYVGVEKPLSLGRATGAAMSVRRSIAPDPGI
jgi:peptidoglycan/LPS O-acetylase OafA/YrhL